MPQQSTSWDELFVPKEVTLSDGTGPKVPSADAATAIRNASINQGGMAEQWLKDKFVGGAKRRVQGLASLPGQLLEAFRADTPKAVVDLAQGVMTAPFTTIKNVVTDPVGTFKEDPLQILEALSLTNAARRGLAKVGSTYVKPLTKEYHQRKSAETTTSVLSPKAAWKTNNERMRTQEPGFKHIPSNAMPGFRLQQMADRMDPEKALFGFKKNATRPSLTDEFLQKLDDQIIAPAETRASALIASDPRSMTVEQLLAHGKKFNEARAGQRAPSILNPERSDALEAVAANMRARGPKGVLHDATPGMPDVEVLDPLSPTVTTRPVGPRALVNGRGLPAGSAIGRAARVADDAADDIPPPRTAPDLDAVPRTVDLPVSAQDWNAVKKSSNALGANKFGKDITDAQFYARDKVRQDIKSWLEEPTAGQTRSTLSLPKDLVDPESNVTLKEANLLEGDALALKRLITDKFQQMGSAPVDNSYRLARLLSSPLAPLAPQARTALIGIGLESPAARLAKSNMQWNLANRLGRSRDMPWVSAGSDSVITPRRIAAFLGSEGDQADERQDPWAALFAPR